MKKIKARAIVTGLILALILVSFSGLINAEEADTRTNVTVDNNYDEDVRNQGDLIAVDVYEVKINGDVVQNGDTIRYEYELGDQLNVRIKLLATDYVPNMEVSVFLIGEEHHTVADTTKTFDAEPGIVYTKDLSLKLPVLMDKDSYKLRVLVGDRYGAVKVYNYNLNVDAQRHAVHIKDVVFTPQVVEAGRALIGIVRVENIGEKDEDYVKVTLSIPELGLAVSDYIDEVESGDQVSSEELYLRIPNCAKAKEYVAKVAVDFNDGYDTVIKEYPIKVIDSELCPESTTDEETPSTEGKTIITVGTEVQNLVKGQAGVVYPVSLTNTGSLAKTFTVSVSGADQWADVRLSPSNVVVLNKGETQTVYVYLKAKDNADAGQKMFSLNIESDGKVVKQIPLTANIEEGKAASSALKKALEIGLIVLIVILIIVGIIIGMSKAKKDEDEGDYDTTVNQTYY